MQYAAEASAAGRGTERASRFGSGMHCNCVKMLRDVGRFNPFQTFGVLDANVCKILKYYMNHIILLCAP